MSDLQAMIDPSKLPRHVAVIMDGNGRWAEMRGKPRIFGHRHGVLAVREITEAAAESGIEWLTLYAFSTENWKRPRVEVNALMKLLVETMRKEIESLNENNIRLLSIGDLSKLPRSTHKALMEGIAKTQTNTKMNLVLALNYSSRWELTEAAKKIAVDVAAGKLDPADISEDVFGTYLATAGIPDPELMIRTSGEMRISNYLLWQLAYSELYFTDIHWPDFKKDHFFAALVDYQKRERRFGKTGDQIRKAITQTTD